jgi:hypothetical protein
MRKHDCRWFARGCPRPWPGHGRNDLRPFPFLNRAEMAQSVLSGRQLALCAMAGHPHACDLAVFVGPNKVAHYLRPIASGLSGSTTFRSDGRDMTPSFLCPRVAASSHVIPYFPFAAPEPATSSPEDAVPRADDTASPWLDLAGGRLRLDRLSRNGGGETFFPRAEAHSSRDRKLSPPPSSAALRP